MEYVFRPPQKPLDLTYVDLGSIRSDRDCNFSFVSGDPERIWRIIPGCGNLHPQQLVELSQLVSAGIPPNGATYTYRLMGDIDMQRGGVPAHRYPRGPRR